MSDDCSGKSSWQFRWKWSEKVKQERATLNCNSERISLVRTSSSLAITVVCSTHSLTAALDQRGPYSDLHNERSCADDHSESIVHSWSSSTCCIQVFLGRPGGRFQSGSGQGICPARGWHSAGGYCGLPRLVVGSKQVCSNGCFTEQRYVGINSLNITCRLINNSNN